MSRKSEKYNLNALDRSWIDALSKEEYAYYVESQPGAIPTLFEMPWVVEYSIRSAQEYVVSGPLGSNRGRGRRFASVSDALAWAKAHFHPRRVRAVPQCLVPQELIDAGIVPLRRWAVLVPRV